MLRNDSDIGTVRSSFVCKAGLGGGGRHLGGPLLPSGNRQAGRNELHGTERVQNGGKGVHLPAPNFKTGPAWCDGETGRRAVGVTGTQTFCLIPVSRAAVGGLRMKRRHVHLDPYMGPLG